MEQFILWDPRQGAVDLTSGGVIGILERGNVYLTAYAEVLDAPIDTLAIGQYTTARFRLSGTTGVYQIWRVK
jgi:hypothetical protein